MFAAWLVWGGALTSAGDYLAVVEPLPAPDERDLFLVRLSTHQVALNDEERAILAQVLAAGYRHLLVYYSMPDPWREKFVDCSPLTKGMAPADFFRAKLAPLRIGETRYSVLRIDQPYGEGAPFVALAPEIARLGARSVTFAALRWEQRGFALQARRHFGVRVHSFNAGPLPRSSPWWLSHGGLERVGAAYLTLLWAYLS